MRVITETKGLTGIAYNVYDNRTKIRTVSIESYKREIDGYTYFILIGNNGKCIESAYEYLNSSKSNAIGDKVIQVREQANTALKLLYTYMELMHIHKPEFIDIDNIKEFKSFLRGGKVKGTDMTFESTTIRRNTTINIYQYYYRKYFRFIGVTESVFYEEQLVSSYRSSGPEFLSHANRVFLPIPPKRWNKQITHPVLSQI